MKPLFQWRNLVASDLGPHPTTRHVLLTLANYMSLEGDSCFPSIDTLVEDTGRARSTVVKHLRKAKEAGWIQVETYGLEGRSWKRNEYVARIPEGVRETYEKRLEKEVDRGGAASGPAGTLMSYPEALDYFRDNKNGRTFDEVFEPVQTDEDRTVFRLRS